MATYLDSLFPNDAARIKAQRAINREIAKRWPDAYYVGGVGWCGPGFADAQAFYDSAEAQRVTAPSLDSTWAAWPMRGAL